MLKFAGLMAKCLANNLCKFRQKVLICSENNEIFVGGVFFIAAPCIVYCCQDIMRKSCHTTG